MYQDHESMIAEIAGALNLTNARLVAVMAEALTDNAWSGPGLHSPAQWLALKSGVSPERAKTIVRVAERRSEFPTVMSMFDRGEFSLEQVAELVKAPAWADAKVTDWGSVATVARLRKTIRKEFFTGDPDEPGPADPEPDDRDQLSMSVTDDHRFRLNGNFDLGRGLTIEAAMKEARESLFERGVPSISDADCLLEICERYLDSIDSPLRRDRSRVWVHLDADAEATTTKGWRLPDSVRDQVCCDGVISPVWERNGVPISVGRARHIVPERTRRVIERRDQGCRVPGCTHDRFVEVHHIIHWADGGKTSTWNLVALCPKHHRLHHQGKLGISGNADDSAGLVFTDERGRPIDPMARPKPPPEAPPGPIPRYQPPLGGRVDYSMVGGSWIHPNELARRRQARTAKRAS